jgi:hypothetical protein
MLAAAGGRMRPEAKGGYGRVRRLPFISRAAKRNRRDPGSSRSPADVSCVLRQHPGLPSEPFITISPDLLYVLALGLLRKCNAFNINPGKYQAVSHLSSREFPQRSAKRASFFKLMIDARRPFPL